MKTTTKITTTDSFTYDITSLKTLRGELVAFNEVLYPDASVDDIYFISSNGKIGGADGRDVKVGDLIIAIQETKTGDHEQVGRNWTLVVPKEKISSDALERTIEIVDPLRQVEIELKDVVEPAVTTNKLYSIATGILKWAGKIVVLVSSALGKNKIVETDAEGNLTSIDKKTAHNRNFATQDEADAESSGNTVIAPSTLGGWLIDLLTRALSWTGIPTFLNGVIFTEKASIPDTEGLVSYVDKALVLKTDIVGSTQSLGQEFWTRVINKTGVTIPDGTPVYISGFDITSGRVTVAPGKADDEATSDIIGFTTNTMVDGAEGFVTIIGFLNDIDTSSFSSAQRIFLSDTVSGGLTATKPLNAIPLGSVTKVDAINGQILTFIARKIIDSPIFSQIVDKTNQKPIVTTPVAVTFDTNDDVRGIIHSITSATEDIIFPIGGAHVVISQPQVERTSGASPEAFHMWFRTGNNDKGGISAISVANPSEITTDANHGLTTGETIEISDVVTTPDVNAQHVITVTGPTTFTIPVNVTVVTDGVGNWRRVLDINDDLVNSNVELRIAGNNAAYVIPLIVVRDFDKNEKINIVISVSNTTNGIGLQVTIPAGEPVIPSIITAIYKI